MPVESALHVPRNAIPFLKSVENGYDVDVRTPLFGGENREVVADRWMKELSAHSDVPAELLDIETKAKTKIGPLSIRLPFIERISTIDSYYTKHSGVVELPESELGSLQLGSRLRPLTAYTSALSLPRNSNSGLPLFQKRNTVLEQSIRLSMEDTMYPAVLGWRGQANGTNRPKQRVVWMYPYSINIREYAYFGPMHAHLVKFPFFAAWRSMDEVDHQITQLINNNSTILSSDFSGYDQSLFHQQKWYFDFLKSNFQDSFRDDIDSLAYIFRNIPLVYSPEFMFTGPHGVPSGSVFTNQCDSVVNFIAQTSSSEAITGAVQIQGDDAVVLVDNVDKHIKHLNDLGFDANPDKQVVSMDTVMYLQRWHHRDYRIDGICRGVYPTMRALNSLLGQERYYTGWSTELVSLRVISILENVKWHPAFRNFIKFVVKEGDPKLKENVLKILKDNSVIENAKALPGFIPTYNTETNLSGISRYESVRAILSL